MFWHFLKVVYSRACESRGVWIKVRKLKDEICLKNKMKRCIVISNTLERYRVIGLYW